MDITTTFLERLPRRPYCTDAPDKGLHVRPVSIAVRHRHIQPNPPLAVAWLVFDLDYVGAALAWEAANLAPPTISAVNPENGHAHLFYGLHTPIAMSNTARDAPVRYGAAIQAAYGAKLRADAGYVGLIAKNPLHPSWRVQWLPVLYDLGVLAEYTTLPKTLPKRGGLGLGRNCTLFDELRAWSYTWVRTYKRNGASFQAWHGAVLAQAEGLNRFELPLTYPEVLATAKSVAKWTWRHFNEPRFVAIQSARGRLGGRPRTTTQAGEPWHDMGISRATYYRRRKNGLLLPS